MAQPVLVAEQAECPTPRQRRFYSSPRLKPLTREQFEVVCRYGELMNPAGAWRLLCMGASERGPHDLLLSAPEQRPRIAAGLLVLRSGLITAVASAPFLLLRELLRRVRTLEGEPSWLGFSIVVWIVVCFGLALNPAWLSERICTALNPDTGRHRLSLFLAALLLNIVLSVAALHRLGSFAAP